MTTFASTLSDGMTIRAGLAITWVMRVVVDDSDEEVVDDDDVVELVLGETVVEVAAGCVVEGAGAVDVESSAEVAVAPLSEAPRAAMTTIIARVTMSSARSTQKRVRGLGLPAPRGEPGLGDGALGEPLSTL